MSVQTSYKNTGFVRVIKASYYSYKGLVQAARKEAAFRQELFIAIVFIPLGLWLDVTTVERILLVASIALVLIVELLNSAVEAVVDRVGVEFHELSGQAKDMGSAAVLLSIFLALFIWLSITWPLLKLFWH